MDGHSVRCGHPDMPLVGHYALAASSSSSVDPDRDYSNISCPYMKAAIDGGDHRGDTLSNYKKLCE